MKDASAPKLTDREIEDYLKNPDVQTSLTSIEVKEKSIGVLRQVFPRDEDLAAVIKSENQMAIILHHRHLMTGYLQKTIRLISKTQYAIICRRDTADELHEWQEALHVDRRGTFVHNIRSETDFVVLLADNNPKDIAAAMKHLQTLTEERDPSTSLLSKHYVLNFEYFDMAKLTDQEKTIFWREFYEAQCKTSRNFIQMSSSIL